MSLSADPDHPEHNPTLLPCRVYLDEAEVKECMYLDTDKGYVVCAARDADGNLLVNRDEIVTEVRHGTVRIEKMESQCALLN